MLKYKKTPIIKPIAFLILLLLAYWLFLASYNSTKKIKLYEMESFAEAKKDSSVVITDSNEIEILSNAINRAFKRPGIADMANPMYKAKLGKETYFVWIDEMAIGAIMNVKDTSTVYSFSEKTTIEVKEIIDKHYNSKE